MSGVPFWIKAVLTLAGVAFAVRQGFFRPPGVFLSWPMFGFTGYYRVTLRRDDTGEPVSPWDYEPHQDYLQTHGLWDLVRFLREEHGISVSGGGVVAGPFGYLRVEVRSGEVRTYLMDGREIDVVMGDRYVVR